MIRKNAFTLAEVLITLGIIGVVAAMTIPTLISNTNGAQFKTAYKKALSTLNQAVLMNIALEDTDFSTLEADAVAAGSGATDGSMGDLLSNRLQSATDITNTYFTASTSLADLTYRTTITCTGNGAPNNACTAADEEIEIDQAIGTAPTNTTWKVYAFADGTSFAYLKSAENCSELSTTCIGFIDVNGTTGPNTPIDCSSDTATDDEITECDASQITDIYPVFFHGQTVEPGNDSARAVLFGK